jgi:hypothetical protein
VTSRDPRRTNPKGPREDVWLTLAIRPVRTPVLSAPRHQREIGRCQKPERGAANPFKSRRSEVSIVHSREQRVEYYPSYQTLQWVLTLDIRNSSQVNPMLIMTA